MDQVTKDSFSSEIMESFGLPSDMTLLLLRTVDDCFVTMRLGLSCSSLRRWIDYQDELWGDFAKSSLIDLKIVDQTLPAKKRLALGFSASYNLSKQSSNCTYLLSYTPFLRSASYMPQNGSNFDFSSRSSDAIDFGLLLDFSNWPKCNIRRISAIAVSSSNIVHLIVGDKLLRIADNIVQRSYSLENILQGSISLDNNPVVLFPSELDKGEYYWQFPVIATDAKHSRAVFIGSQNSVWCIVAHDFASDSFWTKIEYLASLGRGIFPECIYSGEYLLLNSEAQIAIFRTDLDSASGEFQMKQIYLGFFEPDDLKRHSKLLFSISSHMLLVLYESRDSCGKFVQFDMRRLVSGEPICKGALPPVEIPSKFSLHESWPLATHAGIAVLIQASSALVLDLPRNAVSCVLNCFDHILNVQIIDSTLFTISTAHAVFAVDPLRRRTDSERPKPLEAHYFLLNSKTQHVEERSCKIHDLMTQAEQLLIDPSKSDNFLRVVRMNRNPMSPYYNYYVMFAAPSEWRTADEDEKVLIEHFMSVRLQLKARLKMPTLHIEHCSETIASASKSSPTDFDVIFLKLDFDYGYENPGAPTLSKWNLKKEKNAIRDVLHVLEQEKKYLQGRGE